MKKLIEFTFAFIVLMFLTGSSVGFFLGRPVFLSYAYSDSMTPTISRGDLFLMNPFSRNFDVGDIIVFHRRDGWTVHRIFAVTEKGYITKGDHNVATDQQEGKYPEVTRQDIAGKVIVLFGTPLVLRGGGNFIQSLRTKIGNVYAIALFLLIGAFLTFPGESKRRRRRVKYYKVSIRTIYAISSVFIIAGFLFVTVASWGTLAFTYSSTLAGSQRPGWYLPGSTFEKNLSIENRAVYPFYYFVEGESSRAELLGPTFLHLNGSSRINVPVHVTVPTETRVYREEFRVRSYPALLPASLVAFLYSINPYLPLLAYALFLSVILWSVYRLAGISKGEVIRIRKRRRGILFKMLGDG